MIRGLIGAVCGLALVTAIALVAVVGATFGPGWAYLAAVAAVVAVGGFIGGYAS